MPTVKGIAGPYRVFFYSFECNEPMHAHVQRERMLCKFWLRPLSLAGNAGFSAVELGRIRRLIHIHGERIEDAWHEHCG